jgi:hypothetical protein
MSETTGMFVADDDYALQLIEDDAAPAADDEGRAAARHARIALAAYLRAEARGFEPGRELDDWLDAEREVDRNGRLVQS